jgi:hypothetical protein
MRRCGSLTLRIRAGFSCAASRCVARARPRPNERVWQEHGGGALEGAAGQGHTVTVAQIVRLGADPNAQNEARLALSRPAPLRGSARR